MRRSAINLFILLAWAVLSLTAVGPLFSAPPNGDGLLAQYFNNTNLYGPPVFSQVEETVNNFWYTCSPDPAVNVNNFSARYTGYLYVPYSEPYTFIVQVSDGARLSVNGVTVLNQWTPATDPSAVYTSTVFPNLTAGASVPITLEFYDASGEATIQLRWSSATLYNQNGFQTQIIPRAYLFSSLNPSPTSTPTPQVLTDNSLSCAPSSSITVDGQINESAWPTNAWINLTQTAFGSLASNESAAFQTRWNNTNLYVAVTVSTNGTNLYSDSPTYYQDPAVEIYLDTNNSKASTLTPNDYQFIIRAADNAVTEMHGHGSFGTQSMHTVNPNGYVMEVAIPWTTLSLSPSGGTTLGFDVGVDFDRDGTCRDALLLWNGKLKNSDDSTAYGNVGLVNCQTTSTTPTPTPTITFSRTSTLTPTQSSTETRSTTPTFSPSLTWTPSETFSPDPTFSASPTQTETSTSTETSPTPMPSSTPTLTLPWTDTPTSTITETNTPTSSWTKTSFITFTRTPTPSTTPSSTRTWTSMPTASPTYPPGPGCGFSGLTIFPKLNLQVRCFSQNDQYQDFGIRVQNWSSSPVSISRISVKVWTYEFGPMNMVYGNNTAGTTCTSGGLCGTVSNTVFSVVSNFGLCTAVAGHYANEMMTYSFATTATIPPGGSWETQEDTFRMGRSNPQMDNSDFSDDYSHFGSGNGDAAAHAAFEENQYFVLYYDNQRVWEQLDASGSSFDPATGREPCMSDATCTPSFTSTATLTRTPSSTSTQSPSQTSTETLTPTSSPTLTFTSTKSFTPTPSHTFTRTPTFTSTWTETSTATPTRTPTGTFSATSSPTMTPTASATTTLTLTSTATVTATWTSTPTTTWTRTLTYSPTSTYTPPSTPTMTFTPTSTVSATPTISFTSTMTGTPTQSPTPRPPFRPYPDPFAPGQRPDDIVTFPLPNDHGEAKLLIADLHRRRVFEKAFAPREIVTWDGHDSDNHFVRGGVYIYFLEARNNVHRGTLTVLR